MIESRSKGAGTYYVIGKRIWEAEGETSQISAANLPDNALSGKFSLPDNEKMPLVPVLPTHLTEAVAQLGQRTTQEAMRYVIWKLCKHRAFQMAELAAILNRHPKYLSERFISPMIEENELHYTHPENPTHPHQAYKAANKAKKKR